MMSPALFVVTTIILMLIIIGLSTVTGILVSKEDSDYCGTGTHFSHVRRQCMPDTDKLF